MKDISFSKAFLALLNEATIPSISGDDYYSFEDQLELVNENPDIILRMKNPDKRLLKHLANNWDNIDLKDKFALTRSKYGPYIASYVNGVDPFAKKRKVKQSIANLAATDTAQQSKDPKNLYPSRWGLDSDRATILSVAKQLQALSKNSLNILKIKHPSKEALNFFQAAVNNGEVFFNPSDYDEKTQEYFNYLVNVDPNKIDYTKPQPQMNALKNSTTQDTTDNDIEISNEEPTIKHTGITYNPYNILDMDNPDEETQLQAISIDPTLIVDLIKEKNIQPTNQMLEIALLNKPELYPWLSNQPNIKIKHDILLKSILHCPFLICFMDNPTTELVKVALDKRPTLVYQLHNIPLNVESQAHNELLNYPEKVINKLRNQDLDVIDAISKYNPEINWDDDSNDEDDEDYSSLENESVTDYLKRMKKIVLSE